MSTAFDPYYRWLAIPPDEQPPHHYRLLGLNLFEGDPDVIDSSADRQMSHVRTFQIGPRAKESQRILNQISAAKLVLLDPDKKTAYDAQLRAQFEQPVTHPLPKSQPLPESRPITRMTARGAGARMAKPVVMGTSIAAAVVVLIGAILLAVRPWESPSPNATVDGGNPGVVAQKDLGDSRVTPNNNTSSTRQQTQADISPAVPVHAGRNARDDQPRPTRQLPIEPPDEHVEEANGEPQSVVAADGLLAYWAFDEGQGEVARDLAGGFDGRIEGATWTKGVRGGALHFDGQSARVDVGNHQELNFGGPITMAAWIRPDRIPQGITFMNVLDHNRETEPGTVYLRLCNDRYAVGCFMGSHIPTERRVPEGDAGTWVHLAGVYDGQSWHIFRNGELFESRKTSAGPQAFDGPWLIGAHKTKDCFFAGDIDEVRLYKRALQANEIRSLWQADR